jgi:hypothetical protein
MRDGRAVRTAATKVWKILGLRKKMTIDQISVLENLFLINETVPPQPNFSRPFFGRFGRFQWFRSEKIWKKRSLTPVVAPRRKFALALSSRICGL